ncbi:MAG: hypothetical protein WCR72_14340 [Bacteroidota bacterium]
MYGIREILYIFVPIKQHKVKEQIMDSTLLAKKIQIGDFQTLAKMLGITSKAAERRFHRPVNTKRHSHKNEEAKQLMMKIVEARESLINENNPQESTNK